MINAGIVGLGFMAATHIKAYRQIRGVRIAALCNPSGRHLDGDFSRVAGNILITDPVKLDMAKVKAYQDYSELLADPEIHLIDICSPTPSHPALAIQALKAGKHVICEKPLARTAKLAADIVKAASHSKGYFMPAMCLRFWPEWVWVKEAIDDERYGKVLAARFRRVAEPPAWGQKNFLDGERSGGALLDLHIHDVDFVQFCFGRPRSIYATGYTQLSGAIDHVVAQYDVASGAIVHAEGSWAMTPGFGFNMSYTVNFESATADYDMARATDALRLFRKGRGPRSIKCKGKDGFVGELSHMVESIRGHCAPTVVTAEEGKSAIEICEAEEKSIRLGKPVRLAVLRR